MKPKGLLLFLIVIPVIIIAMSVYVVDETQQVVITQFGKVVGKPKTTPGLQFKLPVIQKATYFPKNLLAWDGDPGQIPTREKTYIWVDAFARWKIVDPVKYFQTVTSELSAKSRLDDIIDPAVRNAITSYRLIETVRKSNRVLDMAEIGIDDNERKRPLGYKIEVGREEITRIILQEAQPKLAKFGIELVDVKIKRLNYVEQVRKSVYGRMIAERKQIAEKFRSEGQGEAQKILGEKERDLKAIESEAYRKAQELMGKADAESTKIFAQAFGADPEFYSFVKTLETYKESLDENSSVVLSTDSDLFKYLKGYSSTP